MNSGKLVGLLLSGGIVLLIVFLLMQEGDTKPSAAQTQEVVVKKEAVVVVKTEEEEKLEELKNQTTSGNNTVSQLYALKCQACHGSEGQGGKVGPSIKGKDMAYILTKLDDYKNNRVTNSLMQGLLINATQEELDALAQEISNFK